MNIRDKLLLELHSDLRYLESQVNAKERDDSMGRRLNTLEEKIDALARAVGVTLREGVTATKDGE